MRRHPARSAPLLAAALAAVVAVSLTGCGDDDNGGPDASTPGAGPVTTLTSAAATVVTTTLAVGPVSNGATETDTPAPPTSAGTHSNGTVTPGAGPATGTVAAATQPITVPGPTTAR